MELKADKIVPVMGKIIALANIIVGLLTIIGWHFEIPALIALPPSPFPTPYFSAVCILAIGVGINGIFASQRSVLTKLMGLLILLIVFLQLFLPEIEKILPFLGTKLSAITPMHLFGIIGYSIIGTYFTLWKKKERSDLLSVFLGWTPFFPLFLGAIGIVHYFVFLQVHEETNSYLMTFYPALMIFFSSLCLIAGNYLHDPNSRARFLKYLPWSTFNCFFGFILICVSALVVIKNTILLQTLKTKAEVIKSDATSEFKYITDSMERMGKRIEATRGNPPMWELDAKAYLNDYEGLVAIAELGPDLKIQNQLVKKSHPFDVSQTDLQKASSTQGLYIGKGDSANGHIFLYLTLIWDQHFQGLLIFEIDPTIFISNFIQHDLDQDFAINIFYEGKKILSFNDSILPKDQDQKLSDAISFGNIKLSFDLYPTLHLLSKQFNNTVIYFTLIGGTVTAVCLGLLVHFLQLNRKRLNSVSEIQKKLSDLREEEKNILKSVKVGTFNWDIINDKIYFDEYSYTVLGIPVGSFQGGLKEYLNYVYPGDHLKLEMLNKNILELGEMFDQSWRIVRPDGNIHFIQVKGKFFYETGKPVKLAGVFWDITDIKKAQQYLEISESIAKLLSTNITIPKALSKILYILNVSLGWEVMTLWKLDEKTDLLNCLHVVHEPSVNIPELEKATLQKTLKIDILFPSRRIVSFPYHSIIDAAQDPNFNRSKEAALNNIHGAIKFPIYMGSEIGYVIELFKTQPFTEPVDAPFLHLLASISIEISQYLDRIPHLESDKLLAALFTYSDEGVFSCDLDGIILTWNIGAEKIYGWKAAEIIGQHISKIYPQGREVEFNQIKKRVLEGNGFEMETERIRKDGTRIWVEYSIAPIRDENGNITTASIMARDITEKKNLVAALQQSEEKFRTFIETIEEWIWEVDSNCTITYSNPSIEKILGYTPKEIVGTQMFQLVTEDHREDCQKQMEDFVEKRKGWSDRTMLWQHKNGTTRWLESAAVPVVNEKGVLLGFRGACRDITERKIVEITKNELISIISHELRTPLSSIHGALGLLLQEKFSEKTLSLLSLAYRNSERLTTLINDILDLEKIQAGKLLIPMKPVSISSAITESIISSKSMATKFKVTVVAKEPLSDVYVMASHDRLLQVMSNLLSNAIKFSPEQGTVTVFTEVIKNRIRVSVQDQGKGIPEEFQSKLFTRFAQADSSDKRAAGGSGLGLSICKSIIAQLGGTIDFKTQKNQGTTFYFELPIVEQESQWTKSPSQK